MFFSRFSPKTFFNIIFIGFFFVVFSPTLFAQTESDSLVVTTKRDSLTQALAKQKARITAEMVQDSLAKLVITDTLDRKWYKPDAIRIGVDLSWGIKGLFSKDGVFGEGEKFLTYYANNQAFEVTADMSFKDNRYFLVTDVGYATSRLLKQNFNPVLGKVDNGFQYDVQGAYFRIGFDYNFMRRYFNNEALFVGVRYGHSFFSHSLTYNPLPDSIWKVNFQSGGIPLMKMEDSGLSANWGEVTGGLKVNLWKSIFVGYTVRLIFLGKIYGQEKALVRSFIPNPDTPNFQYTSTGTLSANEIPGYGNTEESFKLGFSFYAYYRIPFRKRPEIVLDK
jgi:hypothetical protein